MKRIIVLFNMLLFTFAMQAQEATESYRPFIEEGKVWVSFYDTDLGYLGLPSEKKSGQAYNYLIAYNYFEGDTVIADKQCKLWVQSYRAPVTNKELRYTLPVFEEGKKVYFFYNGETEPLLAYDFGADVGDSVVIALPDAILYESYMNIWKWSKEDYMTSYTDTIVIHSKAEATVGGRIQKVKYFYTSRRSISKDFVRFNYFMEGIGTHYCPIFNYPLFGLSTQNPWLLCCFIGDEVLYEDEERASYWDITIPNAIRDLPAPMVKGKSLNGKCFDLSGRRLAAPPAKGIYIKDGKKVVME